MKTIILPGYSPHNRDWALDIKKDLKLEHEVLVHEWGHWPSTSSGSASSSFSVPREVKVILEKMGKDKMNIIAKSVGTRVAMHLLVKIPKQVNKAVLCGIPTKGESETAKKNYAPLVDFSPTGIIVFQNTKDPFAKYKDIKKFIGSLKSKIKKMQKPRSDHHYPYPEDFQKFLQK